MQLKEITLANLETSTAQEVFDWVVWNLLKQGQRSATPSGACRYRFAGLKCAAGWCIADSEYKNNWEGSPWFSLERRAQVPTAHMELLDGLQTAHDSSAVNFCERFKQEVCWIAVRHNLSLQILEIFDQNSKNTV